MGSARVKFDVWACRQSRPKYKSAVPELIHTSNLTCAEPNNQSSTFEPGLTRVASHAGVLRGARISSLPTGTKYELCTVPQVIPNRK